MAATGTILYGAADAAAALFATGDARYKVSGMYLEFQNGGGTATPPSYDRGGAAAYYAGLASSPNHDYLRVPLAAGVIAVTDPSLYAGNIARFFAVSADAVGVWGKTFSSTVSSLVYGGALVAMVDPLDASQDVLVARFYFDTSSQLAKIEGVQLSVQCDLPFA